MPIIIITCSSKKICQELGEEVAKALNYDLINDQVLQAASQRYDVEVEKLRKALNELPSLFGLSAETIKRYLAYIRASFAQLILKGDLVYNGPAGHLFIDGVSHVIKVRVIAPLDMLAEELANESKIPLAKAKKQVLKGEKTYHKWVKLFFHTDDTDSRRYDKVINLAQTTVAKATKTIVEMVSQPRYQPMTYSEHILKDTELAYRAIAELVDLDPDIQVKAREGALEVYTRAKSKQIQAHSELIKKRLEALDDITSLEIHVSEDLFDRMAGTMR